MDDQLMEYRILNLYKTKQYNECLKLCSTVQDTNNRVIDFIRMRILSIQAKIAGNGYEEVEYLHRQDELSTGSLAKTPRPGTSFQRNIKTAQNMQLNKKITTGTIRSNTGMNTSRAQSARIALRTAARASRAATAIVSGSVLTPGAPVSLRLLSKDDNLFVPAAKSLYEYVFYCEGDIRKAMEIVFQVQKSEEVTDWWWNYSLARCYYTLGMYRNCEECLRHALKQNKHVSIYLRLVAMYVSLDQPTSALETCNQGLSAFREYTPLLLEQARIHDEMGNASLAIREYRSVAIADPTSTEAVANIAVYNFYNDQPEIALRYYRRLLATTPPTAEIYNNLGLCCLYCNQWDLILPCFKQAIFLSTNTETRAEVWFNVSHVALSTGDLPLFRRCLQVCLAVNSEHFAAKQAMQALGARLKQRDEPTALAGIDSQDE